MELYIGYKVFIGKKIEFIQEEFPVQVFKYSLK